MRFLVATPASEVMRSSDHLIISMTLAMTSSRPEQAAQHALFVMNRYHAARFRREAAIDTAARNISNGQRFRHSCRNRAAWKATTNATSNAPLVPAYSSLSGGVHRHQRRCMPEPRGERHYSHHHFSRAAC
jgi:hypothetical protein